VSWCLRIGRVAAVAMSGGLLVAGTCSDAGKSVIVAGLCRWLARRGIKVAPFKSQNMALNSAVTADGEEIGRAQAAQAAAAGIEPEVAMNPILLKPTGERTTQVIVRGKPVAWADARSYHERKGELMDIVMESLAELRNRFDVVICEGAGSPAEINLRANDLVNMGLARAADLPVVVVADIDRGGAFASLYGTLALLEPADQALISGFMMNKFRGDVGVLQPGLDDFQQRTGRPTIGVVPWVRGLWMDVEDSLALEAPRDGAIPPVGTDSISVAVIRLRWISNFTDFDALASEPGVTVRFTQSPADVASADLVIVPGSKATVEDLEWMRTRGLDRALMDRATKGDPTLGICGGYQMFGEQIVDDVESSRGRVDGLGLLPVTTSFAPDKLLDRPRGTAPLHGDEEVSGYQIRHGRVARYGGVPLFVTDNGDEGAVVGSVSGTSWHGIFECDGFRRSFLAEVAERRGLDWVAGTELFADLREARFDVLADLIEEHCDTDAIERLIAEGAPAGLPLIGAAA